MDWGSAIASVMGGVSGSGVLGNWDGGWSTYSSSKSRTKYAANKAYEMQQKAALEMPSTIREGLNRAGLNPLLATSAFGSVNAGNPSFSEASMGGSSLSFDGSKSLLAKEQKEQAKLVVEDGKNTVEEGRQIVRRLKAENDATEASAKLEKLKSEIELEALEDYQVDEKDDKGKPINPTRQALRESIRNRVHKSEYENNWTRSLVSDVLGSILGLSSAFSNSASGTSSLRNSNRVVIPKGGRLLRLK